MATFVNEKIYELLQEEFSSSMELAEADVLRATHLRRVTDANKLQDKEIKGQIENYIQYGIDLAYSIPEKNLDAVAAAVVKALIAQYGPKTASSPSLTAEEIQQLEYAFTEIQYVGNAHVKFGQYLRRCYDVYQKYSTDYKAPYVAVAQSSGFGKSRMIRELAMKAKDDQDLNIKVLYTCSRVRNSTGYPKATPVLSRWLLEVNVTEEGIAKRLKAIFHCATEHWNTVQTQWLGLFTNTTTAAAVTEALEKTLKRQEAKATEKTAFNKEERSDKLVLVVIDEARNLIDNTTSGLDYFHLLERALVLANYGIGKEGRIFAVLVDTNPRLTIPGPLPPPHKVDPSSRGCYSSRNVSLFPPFVLAHTMDAFWQQYCRNQLEDGHGAVEKGEEDREDGDGLGTTGRTS